MKVVIAGGGTAGHVFPAIALADRLRREGAAVEFIGSGDGQEARLVPEAGYPFHAVRARKMNRTVSARTLTAPFVSLRSVRDCRPLVDGVDAVVGMGGYVSAAPVLAARGAGSTVVLHEQNAVPGLANRLLARRAAAIALSFADARDRFPRSVRTVVTGNPVRTQILTVPLRRQELADQGRRLLELEPGRTTVIVLGGSQGALSIDRAVAGAIALLRERADLQLLVLTGPPHLDVVAQAVALGGKLRVRALPFLDRMELAYALGDLVVARAGATSIAEIAACGIPSILIPYPHASANHQEANAHELQRAGAAEVVHDRELTPERLARRLLEAVDDRPRLTRMAEAARAWAKPDADQRLAELVLEVHR